MKISYILFIVLLCSLSSCLVSRESTLYKNVEKSKAIDLTESSDESTIVYISPKTEYYHPINCPDIKGFQIPVSLDSAKRRGYKECSNYKIIINIDKKNKES